MSGSPVTKLVFGHVELRLGERRVLVDGQTVALGSRSFDLLKALVNKRERVVSKEELLDEVWPGLVVEENNLQVQISGLRRVLGAAAIATVPGLGYQFTLPLGPAETAETAEATDKRQPAQQAQQKTLALAGSLSARVLVADDNRVNRLLLCRSLELMGHQVSAAANGRAALEMLRQQPFDLLLLDLAMPELDGFGLLQERAGDAALCEVAVIVTSALGGVAPVARCIELGVEDFLHKPVDPWLLKARVDASLNAKLLRDQQRDALRRLMPAGPSAARCLPDVTVLVAGLHGLAALDLSPDQMQELLSDWCTLMFDAIDGRGGELAQFSGDGLLALFSEPQAAVQAAQEMGDLMRVFNEERLIAELATVNLGCGLARGQVLACSAATSSRAAYACIGAPVAQAQRLAAACSLGTAAGEAVFLMDAATRAGLSAEFEIIAVAQSGAEAAYSLL
ncbi:response regulator [Paucibacter sp. B2R-40]|uniref:response regulator n=1 Tax=Paucibacter sp. B2R-40 TaxID=2893554 RepID=UPI0021E4173A|nr:response regulator [Paucibacter sp. B2R-40]MCV2356082.1 response regulator [Paucibacter sp. B2R-40]